MAHQQGRSEVTDTTWDVSEGEVDCLLDVLAVARRRDVLRRLDGSTSIALADLARELARRERDSGTGEPSPERVRRMKATLELLDVPKLDEAGLVYLDRDRNTVQLTEIARLAGVADLLEHES